MSSSWPEEDAALAVEATELTVSEATALSGEAVSNSAASSGGLKSSNELAASTDMDVEDFTWTVKLLDIGRMVLLRGWFTAVAAGRTAGPATWAGILVRALSAWARFSF